MYTFSSSWLAAPSAVAWALTGTDHIYLVSRVRNAASWIS